MIEDNVLAVDYETEYSRSYSLTNMPTWAYVFDDRFNAYLVSIVGDKGFKFAGHPKDFDWAQLEGKDVLHHNATFDAIVTTRLQQDGVIAKFTPANVFCTADMAACLKLPRALKEIAKHLYGDADRARKGKNARDKMKGKNAVDLIDDPEILEYVIADATDCLRLWQDYNHLWLPEERELSRLNRESCFQGIKVDLEYVEDCIVRLQKQLFQAERDIPWKWPDGKTPLARKMMVAQCEKDGIPLPTQAETEKITFAKDDAAYIEWEEKYKDSFAWIKAVQNWRRKNMLLGKFIHLRNYTDEKGVYHFNKKYCGSHTGRFSGSGSFNMENLPRDEMFCDAGDDGKPVKGTGFDLRRCFIASTEAGLGIIDYAQIEARILLAMVKDDAALEEIRRGTSVYEAHARATMGWIGGVLKDEDPDLYRLAKARCVSGDTLVLTDRGYVTISKITLDDMVWDGVEFVKHCGTVCNGTKDTANINGDWVTDDHRVFISEAKAEPRRDLYEREQTAAVFRRACDREKGGEVRALAGAVTQVSKEVWSEGLSLFTLQVRRVWGKTLGILGQSEGRKDDTVQRLLRTENP